MKTPIRIIVSAALISMALTVSTFTLSGYSPLPSPSPAEESLYTLRTAEGRVAVYHRDNPSRPMLITDIPLDSLREGDRAMLDRGLSVESPEALALLLEDLGN